MLIDVCTEEAAASAKQSAGIGKEQAKEKASATAQEAKQKASETATLEYLKARYLIDAGRAYRAAGKAAEATTAYLTVIEKYPNSTSFTEAQVRLAELTDGKM